MKKGDLKRIFKQMGIGALIGGPIGMAVGYFGLDKGGIGISQETIIHFIAPVFRYTAILALGIGLYYFYQSKKEFKEYQLDEGDENDRLYRSLNIKYGYASIFLGVSVILAILAFCIGINPKYGSQSFELFFSVIEFVVIILIAIVQSRLLKFYGHIRGIDVTTQPTLKELKNNILQQDEAGLLANYKTSFDIVMNLSGLILPCFYGFLLLISAITHRVELTGYLAVASVHFYIMIMNFRMVKEYYK